MDIESKQQLRPGRSAFISGELKAGGGGEHMFLSDWSTLSTPQNSVADPGCLSRIPDPDFYPSRIRGSKNSNDRQG
jgi:hypothetical protein